MSRVLVAATFAGGLVLAGSAAASAHGHGPPSGGAASGSVSCAVNAVLDFSPALQSGATGKTDVSLHMQLTRCTAAGLHHRTTGHASADLGSIANGSCTLPSSAPGFSGLSIRWTPAPHVPASSVSSSGGTLSTLSDGRGQAKYSDLAVTGSFATTSSTLGSATLTTKGTVAALTAACNDTSASGGVSSIAIGGSATL
ncbi:MAG TPA: hypothetical protein VKR22_16300 [Acidimicrobiales bacterium]|nr:hypothetical protein [Acidimicrobiales bacterium]